MSKPKEKKQPAVKDDLTTVLNEILAELRERNRLLRIQVSYETGTTITKEGG